MRERSGSKAGFAVIPGSRALQLLSLLCCSHCSDGATDDARSHDDGGQAAGGSANSSGNGAEGGASAGSPTGGSSGTAVTPGQGGASAAGAAGSATAGGGPTGGAAGAGTGGTAGGSGTESGGTDASGAAGDDSPGLAGSGGQFAGDRCNFRVQHSQSSAIPTVTIVTWSTDLAGLSEAHIDFGPAGSDMIMTAPVDLEQAENRTLLLGMKSARDYSFRIVASSSAEICTSLAVPVTTGPLPDNVPFITKTETLTGGLPGFFLTTPGIGASQRGLPSAYIFDTDGDLVWWTPESAEQMAAARMSWDGQAMWIVNANGGALYRTPMDGLGTESFTGEAIANHDVAPLPEGGVATFGRIDGKDTLIAVSDDGTAAPIVTLEDVYDAGGNYHPNALAYHPADDSFTIGDLTLDGFVKVKRNGDLVWQLGGASPLGPFFELVGLTPWNGNHGHDLGPDGRFLFFNNFPSAAAGTLVIELELDETAWTATQVWDHGISLPSQYLGGTQRLPNGNTSIAVSQAGIIYEVNAAGETVRTFSNAEYNAERSAQEWAVFGYASFRPTLYGPPASTWPRP